MVRAQALPNTTRSSRELAPSRLAPWTLAQADSPQAYSPGTTLSFPSAWVITCSERKKKAVSLCQGSNWKRVRRKEEMLEEETRVDLRSCAHITHLSLVVCGYSTHVVMNRWQDRDGFFSDVDTSKDHGRLRNTRQPCGQLLGRQVVKLQVHMVLFWTNTPEGTDSDRMDYHFFACTVPSLITYKAGRVDIYIYISLTCPLWSRWSWSGTPRLWRPGLWRWVRSAPWSAPPHCWAGSLPHHGNPLWSDNQLHRCL